MLWSPNSIAVFFDFYWCNKDSTEKRGDQLWIRCANPTNPTKKKNQREQKLTRQISFEHTETHTYKLSSWSMATFFTVLSNTPEKKMKLKSQLHILFSTLYIISMSYTNDSHWCWFVWYELQFAWVFFALDFSNENHRKKSSASIQWWQKGPQKPFHLGQTARRYVFPLNFRF